MNTRQFLGLDEALVWLQRTVSPPDASPETIELTDALNRIVAHTVHSPMDVPPFAASSMDGYAVCTLDPVFSGSPPFTLAMHGESRAGAPFSYEPNDEPRIDHAVRIFTGAVLPARCDAVVIQEDVERVDSGIVLSTIPRARANVRAPGNDIARGAVLADAGLRLSPFDLAWLTACGLTKITVRRKIRLALFSTGDELRNAGETLQSGQIYDANRFALVQLMRDAPVDVNDLGILPDDPSAIETTLRAVSEDHDVVMTSGGVSVGDADYVRDIVARLGRIEFWKIAIKPGKPFAYGRIGACHFFGLPGNPVSTIVTYLMLVKPILALLTGTHIVPPLTVSATLKIDIAHEAGRTEYQRGTFDSSDSADGRLVVAPTSDQSSNRIGSFRGANCLIEVPRTSGNLLQGNPVTILPLTGLLN